MDGLDIEERKLFCCPPEEAKQWTNCEWKGKPGSCYDNQCALNSQVQLATSAYGFGESCFPQVDRSRVFCCDPTDGEPLFMPVPLDYLFPDPPDDDSNVDFELEIDDTWGTGNEQSGESNDPDHASFGFVVLTSPEEIQVSLDKRDGSHWELWGCEDTTSEEAQTIKMACMNNSESSNCHKIFLGHGAEGTILEMPRKCGPGKYAVAKSMVESTDQSLPTHLKKRSLGHTPKIYDLTFDYDFALVPRDMGDTLMRIDFSNEQGYWDHIVDRAASTKKKAKRSLRSTGGNHRRWLEEEWRDDLHFGGLEHSELHKRWFADDVIAWLKELLSPSITTEVAHTIDQSFTADLIDKKWNCAYKDIDLEAKLRISATANVKIDTSFGLTIITTLRAPPDLPDLSKSYLYFKNKGNVEAVFTVDAYGKASFESPDWKLAGLDNFPGATFRVPGLVTIGPNFALYASVDAEMTLAGQFEARVNLAEWDVQQTYPAQTDAYEPKAVEAPDAQRAQKVSTPEFDYSLSASGQITAHLRPTVTFGLKWDDRWDIDGCYVDLVAHGYVRLHASAEVSSSEDDCPFKYGIDVGANLYAAVEAPSVYGWDLSVDHYQIGPTWEKQLYQSQCPGKDTDLSGTGVARRWLGVDSWLNDTTTHRLARRTTVEPSEQLPAKCFVCPPKDDVDTCTFDSDDDDGSDTAEKRRRDLLWESDLFADLNVTRIEGDDEDEEPDHWHLFDKRDKTKGVDYKSQDFCNDPVLKARSPGFQYSSYFVDVSYPPAFAAADQPIPSAAFEESRRVNTLIC